MGSRGVMLSAVFLVIETGTVFAQPFSVTAPGLAIDEGAEFIPLDLPPGISQIEQLEVEIHGLTYTHPTNLDFYLINPFAMIAELMSNRGGTVAISSVDLNFMDSAVGVPSLDGPIVSGVYRPEGVHNGTDGGLAPMGLNGSGSDPWVLVILMDTPGGSGGIESFTIRGVGVVAAVPAVGAWGLAIVTLMGLIAGSILFRSSRAAIWH